MGNQKKNHKKNPVKGSGKKGNFKKSGHQEMKTFKKNIEPAGSSIQQSTGSSNSGNKSMSALQQKFAKKLEGARFRVINEKLYKTSGTDAFKDFQSDPSQFDIYHVGFREQAAQWPYNPLDGIINWIKNHHQKAIIADVGCGDARLASSVKNKVHSFDLVSKSKNVIACDMANLPLPDESVNIAVYCLALMGTNIPDFVREARRILKPSGILRIAEVRSRFEEEGNSIKLFRKFLKRAGFDLNVIEVPQNKMFFELECVKANRESVIDPNFAVKACVYKKR